MSPSHPSPPDPKHFMFVQMSKAKNLIYEAQRREHTDRARQRILEQREYEVLWQWIVCGFYQEWSAKHG